jgi:hypothetical protein
VFIALAQNTTMNARAAHAASTAALFQEAQKEETTVLDFAAYAGRATQARFPEFPDGSPYCP